MKATPAQRIAEIRARIEAATPGPWESDRISVWGPPGSGFAIYGAKRTAYGVGEYGPIAVTCDGEYVQSRRFEADAEFIAHARADIEWLLAMIEGG